MTIESFKLDPTLKCPYCDKKLDGAICTTGENKAPREGDYSICLYCHGFLEFKITNWAELKIRNVKNPEIKVHLLNARKLIRIYGQTKHNESNPTP